MASGTIDFSGAGDDGVRTSVFSTLQSAQAKAYRVIQDEIARYGLPDAIAVRAAEIYRLVSNGKTHRELPRRRLLFYCTFCAMVELGRAVDPVLLGHTMGGLSLGDVRKAFTRFATHPGYTLPIVVNTPDEFVRDIAERTRVMDEYHIQRAVSVAAHLVREHPRLCADDLGPVKVATVLVCIYCEKNGIAVDVPALAKTVCLSVAGLTATRKKIISLMSAAGGN